MCVCVSVSELQVQTLQYVQVNAKYDFQLNQSAINILDQFLVLLPNQAKILCSISILKKFSVRM